MPTQQEKCDAFSALHSSQGAFLIPNPWDAGTARILQGMGFKALATTSSGFAFTLAKSDGAPSLEEKLEHCRLMAAVTDIPISVDFEDGYGATPEAVEHNVTELIETGVAGCSIEDWSRQDRVLFDCDAAVERLAAAIAAARATGLAFMVTARCENLIRGVQDLDDTIARLIAYQQAGADVLYAPGIATLDDLRTVTEAVDLPVNVLGVRLPGATLADFEAAGARRVSIGGALTYASLKPVIEFGRAMAETGDFSWVSELADGRELADLMRG